MHYCPYPHEISPTAPGKITTYLAMQPNTCKLANLSVCTKILRYDAPLCSTGRMFGDVRSINDIRRVKSKVGTWFEVLEEAARRISSPIISKEKERINHFCLQKGSMWAN